MKKMICLSTWFIGFFFFIVSAWAYQPFPDTGQNMCYDFYQTVPCDAIQPGDPYYGQDGHYQPRLPRSYTKLGHGGAVLADDALHVDNGGPWIMTRDNVTGLIWEVKTNANRNDSYSWSDAHNKFIANLNSTKFGGHEDWRLPNREDLLSLVNHGKKYSKIDETWFPHLASPPEYWSSTTFAGHVDLAWEVGFYSGFANLSMKPASLNVRAVRGGHPASSVFMDNGDGTVTDKTTGLMWQKCVYGQTWNGSDCSSYGLSVNWQEALEAAEGLTLGGYNDWRLPNINELLTLVYDSTHSPARDTDFFPGFVFTYWSSTTLTGHTFHALYVDDYAGEIGSNHKSASAFEDEWGNEYWMAMRAVRGGQAGSFGNLQVSIEPQEIHDSAQWRRTGTSIWRNSGYTESNIPVGSHTVEFKEISGWIKPANISVSIQSGQTTNVTGIYEQKNGNYSLTININNIPEATWQLTGIWRVDLYDKNRNSIQQKFGSGKPEVIFNSLEFDEEYNYKVYYQHDDDQAIWEYWGNREVTIFKDRQVDDFVRVQPWCTGVSSSTKKLKPGDNLTITITIKNDLSDYTKVKVEGKWGGGQVFSSSEKLVSPLNKETFRITMTDVSYASNQDFFYWIKAIDNFDFDENWKLTDHSVVKQFVSMETPIFNESWALIYGFEDLEGNIWQIGVPKGIIIYPWKPSVYPEVRFFKNGKQDSPNPQELQKLLEAVSRDLEIYYPNLGLGNKFNEKIGIWHKSCGLIEKVWCEGALLKLNQDKNRKELYMELIWEAITSRKQPFLLREFHVGESDTSPGCFTAAPPVEFIQKLDNLIKRFGNIEKYMSAATDYADKILYLIEISKTDPNLRHELENNDLLSHAQDILGAGDLVLGITLEYIQYVTLMEFLATTGRAENRIETLIEAYDFVKQQYDIDPILGDAIYQVRIDLSKQIMDLKEGIKSSFFVNITKSNLQNSEWVQKKLIQLLEKGGGYLIKTFTHLTGHKLAMANTALSSTFRIALATNAVFIKPGAEWSKIHAASFLSKILTLYAESDVYRSGYLNNYNILTESAISKHQIRDVFDMLTSFQLEYMDSGIQLVESDWSGVVSDALVGVIATAKNPKYYAFYSLQFASTSLLFGKEIGNSLRNWIFSDGVQAIFNEQQTLQNNAEKKNAALNEWAELLEHGLSKYNAERILNWAESIIPELLPLKNKAEYSFDALLCRYYPETGIYLGGYQGRLLYYQPDLSPDVFDLGSLDDYLPFAVEAGF